MTNPYDNAPPPMGDNNPPEQTPAERVEELILAAEACPAELSREQAERAMLLAKQLKLEHTRLSDEKGQFLNEAKKAQTKAKLDFDPDMKKLDEGRGKVLLAIGRWLSDNGEMRLANGYGQNARLDADVSFQIVDLPKLPRKYMKPDDAAIKKAIKADTKIPGVLRVSTPKAIVS